LLPILYNMRRLFTLTNWATATFFGNKLSPDIPYKDQLWIWFGRGLAALNAIYYSLNLFGFLIPFFLPRAFEQYFHDRDQHLREHPPKDKKHPKPLPTPASPAAKKAEWAFCFFIRWIVLNNLTGFWLLSGSMSVLYLVSQCQLSKLSVLWLKPTFQVMASEAYHICQMLVIYLMLQIQVLGKYRFPVSKYEILRSCCNVCESDSLTWCHLWLLYSDKQAISSIWNIL